MRSLEDVIGTLVASFRGSDLDTMPGLADSVDRWSALPAWLDMGGAYAIRRDGSVVSWAWDEERLRVETDPRIRNIALFQAARRYPDLEPFVPVRSADAVTCTDCDGSGRPKGIPASINNVVCYCGGCGWLPSR